MKLSNRSTALAFALAALATNASADLISYEFDFHPTSWSCCTAPVINGYITIDDALMQSHGSGDLVAWDLWFNGTPAENCPFGLAYQCGNDLIFPVPGPVMWESRHFSHNDAVVTFADGVPVAMSYSEQHAYNPRLYRELQIHPTAGSFFDPNATYQLLTYSGGSVGTYSFGAQIPVVPEPETWALLLSGLAVIGASSRRRRIEGAQSATVG